MKKKPSLDEVLAKYDENAPIPDDMKEWMNMPDVGREKIHIEESEVIKLSLADQALFAGMLLNPPEPSDALKRAVGLLKVLTAADSFGDREKINVEELEDFDTAEFLNDDEAIVKFLKDIVKDRDPGLLDHAVEIIKKRWKSDADKK